MSEQNNTPNNTITIPAVVPLGAAFLGLVVAVVVAFTQPEFNIWGFAGLAVMIIGFATWVLFAPEQARDLLTGRTVRFGGTSLVVTVVFLVALAAVYTLVKGQNLRVDLTERNEFSLMDESRDAIARLAVDPNAPDIKLVAFYETQNAADREQDSLLFEDYVETSGGKISYEFVDPLRNPVVVEQYGVTSIQQVAVVRLDENGEPDTENAELVNFGFVSSFSQEQLTNAILKAASSGDFRAYFLDVEGGLTLDQDMVSLNQILTDQFDWTTQSVQLFELLSPESAVTLNDPAADGEVLVISGGSEPLAADQLAFITEYLDNGGNVVIFSSPGVEGPSLTTAENLSAYLMDNFGLRFNDDLILDQTQAITTALNPVATDFDAAQFITSILVSGQDALAFDLTQSIAVAETPPENVTVTELARSGPNAYRKTDVPSLLTEDDLIQAEGDETGPFVLAAAAENIETGARLVLFGSQAIPAEQYAFLNAAGIFNQDAAFRSLVWASSFDDFALEITVPFVPNAQDSPIVADVQAVRTINFITVILLPFGVLGIGIFVWWNNRERAR